MFNVSTNIIYRSYWIQIGAILGLLHYHQLFIFRTSKLVHLVGMDFYSRGFINRMQQYVIRGVVFSFRQVVMRLRYHHLNRPVFPAVNYKK